MLIIEDTEGSLLCKSCGYSNDGACTDFYYCPRCGKKLERKLRTDIEFLEQQKEKRKGKNHA